MSSTGGTAVKRLIKELKEIKDFNNAKPTPTTASNEEGANDRKEGEGLPFEVFPLPDSFLCWHFTLKGPDDSVFSQGLYHGRIDFPSDYPFAPPSVYFLTPNGRFDLNVKICLSVTGFHPESWQPAWGVRTMLLALRDHFTVEDKGAIGYLAFPGEERRTLALRSRHCTCSMCGYNVIKQSDNGEVSSKSSDTLTSSTNEVNNGNSFMLINGTMFVIAVLISWLMWMIFNH